MTKQEFIDALSEKLREDFDEQAVYNETRYYIGYIDAEIAKGRPEEDVTAELGDPILIARNIADSPRNAADVYAGDAYEQGYSEAEYQAVKREMAEVPEAEAAEEVDFQELPPYREPEPRQTFDNGFFERQPEQQVEKTQGSFFKGADGNFNWGLITGILLTLLVVVVIIAFVARVISFFWPVIVIVAVFTGISSLFKRRR